MKVHGSTAEERRAARAKQTAQRRLRFFADAIRNARNGRQRLELACQFARAVGDDQDDAARTEMARQIAEIADRRNRSDDCQ